MVDGGDAPKKKGKDGGSNLDIYDPLYLHHQKIGSQLITFKLEGTENYKVWSAVVQLALHTRNKIGFINGKCIRDENAGPLQDQWDRCNAVVLSWLLGSVSQDVYKGQIFSKSSKLVWDELKETYNKHDGSVIFNLHHKIYTLSQSGMSLSEYYHECNALWRQFDALIDLPDCTCVAAQKVKDHGQLLRLMQFLMGLDDMYNSVRSLILTTEPLPDLRSAFATLSRDESHRNSGSSSKFIKTGPTAFVSRPSNGNNWNTNKTGNNNNNNFRSNRRFGRMSNLVCKHCNMTGHTIDRCFELVDYPQGFKRNNSGQSNTNNATNNDIKADQIKNVPNTLANDQYQRLMALLSDTGNTSKTHASIAGFNSKVTEGDLRSNDPYDDGGDNVDNGNISAPKGSVNSPNDSTVGDAAKDQSHVQTDNTDTIDLSGSSPSRKVNQDNQYTETEVSEGIQNTTDNDDNYESEGKDLEGFDNLVFTSSLNKIHEPSTYAEAIKDNRWVEAMNQEIKALNKNNSWVITELPEGRKAIGYKWIYKVEYKANGDVERFKARLVAKGFNQRDGIDYEETFSPVVKIVTIRCILSIVVNNKWPFFQLDINNAFLYGELEEDVYMSMPEGYSDQDVMLIMLVYVDDIIVTGNNADEINKFKQFLGSKVLIKDLVMHKPMQSHLRLAFRVLRYLKKEPGLGITFRESDNSDLRVFVDSDWAKCKITRRFISGYYVFLGNSLVSLKSKKQAVVSRSSTKAEYRAMCNVCCEVLWIRKVLTDLQVNISLPVEMSCVNSLAIQITANPVLHERSKHFEIDSYFLRKL
nr:putative Gag-polypeptide of LTR copia-type [Tanacetum cinerariifolium]